MTEVVRAQLPAASADARRALDVAVLVYPGVELLDFAGPSEVFAAARVGARKPFRVYTVAESSSRVTSQSFLDVTPQFTFDDAPEPDIVVLPGGAVPLAHERVIEWIERVSQRAEVVMSVGSGAQLLGKAGLLDGRACTADWTSIESLMIASPDADVREHVSLVDSGAIVTTAGASAGIDGALHVVARFHGREVASETARRMDYAWPPAETCGRADAQASVERTLRFRLCKLALEGGLDAAMREVRALIEQRGPAAVPSEEDFNRFACAMLDAASTRAIAIRLFEFNVVAHPQSCSAADSLSEACERDSQKARALQFARKALELFAHDPSPDACRKTRARDASAQRLQRLGGG